MKNLSKTMLLAFGILIFINFISLFTYDLSTNGSNYFLGYYNTLMLYAYPGILLSTIYAKEYNTKTIPLIMTLACILTLILSKATIPLGSLIASIGVFVLIVILKKVNIRLPKHTMLISFIFIVLFNIYILFFYDAENTMLLRFFIEKILKRNTTFTGRIGIWEKAIEMIKQNPIVGYGYDKYIVTNFIARHAHNEFLQVLVKCGIIGFIIFIAFIYMLIKKPI